MHDRTDGPVGGITVVETPDATIVRLWGEIDEALREQAGGALERALERELAVVLDAGQVRFIDSTGIAFLIQFCRTGREEGLEVALLDPPPVVADVLEMLGLTDLFDAVDAGGPGRTAVVEPAGQTSSPASGPAAASVDRDHDVDGEPPLVLS